MAKYLPDTEIAGGVGRKEERMETLRKMWTDDSGQDIAEYATMLAVIIVTVVVTIRLIGMNANNVFSSIASTLR